MSLKQTLMPLLFATGFIAIPSSIKTKPAAFITNSVNAAKVENTITALSHDSLFTKLAADTFSVNFSDQEKIINYNKLLKKYKQPNGNYIIVDKKKCSATVYSPDGDTLYRTEVALGRNIGDKRGGGYKVKGAKLRAYTTPGEFEIAKEGSRSTESQRLYGDRVMTLAGDHTMKEYQKSQVLALHRVPLSRMGILREEVLKNNTIKDNRVSYGCVNFLEASYDKMRALIKGVKTKVYILPEERGNSLFLEKQSDGTYKFVQSKYRTEAMENVAHPVKHK